MRTVRELRDKVVHAWEHLNTAIKLLIVIDILAICLLVVFFATIRTTIIQQMRANIDVNLHYHFNTLHTILAREGRYLCAEAHALAGLEDITDALNTRDVRHLRRTIASIRNTHNLDVVYIATDAGDVLLSAAPHGFDFATAITQSAVQKGRLNDHAYRFLISGGEVWMTCTAPHIRSDGQTDALLLLARAIDHDYLRDVSTSLGSDIFITDGQLLVSSLPPEDHDRLLLAGYILDSAGITEQRFQDARINGATYRLLMAPLRSTDSPALTIGLLQPIGLIENTSQQATLRIIVLGILLIGMPFVLTQFLVRAIFKPLRSLMRAAEAIAAGHLDQPIQVEGTAEVQALATSFNQMRIRLQAYMEEQRRWNEELDAQVRARTRELEQLFRIRDQLVAKLIFAQEEERQRIARDLHDETSQALASLVVALGTEGRLTHDEKTRQRLEQVKRLAIAALEGVKRIVLDLRPRLLDDFGLLPAIQWYAEERLYQEGVDVTIETEGNEARLPSHIEIGVFRVIQEAVNNIARHAHATQARIRMAWQSDKLVVEIEDDGYGFDVQKHMSDMRRNGGLGLLSMQERVALAGGTFTIDSAPGMGTRIRFEIPLPRSEAKDVQDPSTVGR